MTRAGCLGIPRPPTLGYFRDFRFGGDIDGYAEGELYFPGSPVLSVGSFAECVMLETLALSIFNHDVAIASGAARMVSAARRTPIDGYGITTDPRTRGGRSGPRRLPRRIRGVVQPVAQRRYGIPTEGTSAHAFTMLHSCYYVSPEAAELPHFARRSMLLAWAPRCWSIPMT